MHGLSKLSKYAVQSILLFLMDYTLVFLCSLMICNSTTDEIFASHSVYFLFMKNGHIIFILELSNQNEKGISDLFSQIFCQTPTTFTQMDSSCATRWLCSKLLKNNFQQNVYFKGNCFHLEQSHLVQKAEGV